MNPSAHVPISSPRNDSELLWNYESSGCGEKSDGQNEGNYNGGVTGGSWGPAGVSGFVRAKRMNVRIPLGSQW